METILATIGAIALTWWFIIGMFVLAIITDYNQSKKDDFGWAAFYTIIALVCLYLHVDPSTTAVIVTLVCWVPAGLIWAVFKWKLRISKIKYEIKTKNIQKSDSVHSEYHALKCKLDVDRVKSTIAYWVLFFPVSIFSTCFVNVFDAIEYLVTVKLGSMFRRMADKAFE